MKTERNILIAFILNLAFAIFEFFGGIFTGSVAIASDAVHDFGDAMSVGVAFFLERKSKRKPDEKYTYGYTRYAIIGGFITSLLLLISSVTVVSNAVIRIFNPVEIKYDGMIIFAVVGVLVNFTAAFFTREKGTLNQRAVNLHMLEDVLGWIVVLVGAIVMRFTNFSLLDPILSICVAVFIAVNAVCNLKEAFEIFLDKTPHGINIQEIKERLCELEGVQRVHHIHIWSLDGHNHCATLHIVTNDGDSEIKAKIREELKEYGIGHATVECERVGEPCGEEECRAQHTASPCGHAHHHHARHHHAHHRGRV